MCGRYPLINLAQLTDLFPWIRELPEAPPRYNIAPTQPILALANNDPTHLDFFHWGLVPTWANDTKIGNQLCNARAESLAARNPFKHAYKRRRCLIPADGFYEWKKIDKKTRQPLYIRLKSGRPFAFAGLWENWHSPQGSELKSATIITTEPNSLIRDIHDRMPVILRPEHYQRWLDAGEKSPPELDPLLVPYPGEEMEAHTISTQVNSPKNE